MSLPSASGDERYGDSKPQSSRNRAGPSFVPFLGGLPLTRLNNEPHPDSTEASTPSSLSLPIVDQNQHEAKAQHIGGSSVSGEADKKIDIQPDSKPRKPTPIQKVDIPGDTKAQSATVKSEDDEASVVGSSEVESDPESEDPFTVYDAVAGRLGYDGLVRDNQQPIAASDYLFRYQQGPEQDRNYEQFSAHRHLEHRLPDSDLLKAIHMHASDFYGAHPDAEDSFKSMDETALIAMGILLEEATAEKLGETGDLAFTEAARPEEADQPPRTGRRVKRQKIKHESDVKVEGRIKFEPESSEEKSDEDDRGRSSGQKRRRGAIINASDIATEEDAEQIDEDDPSHNSEVESWISQTFRESQEEPNSHFGVASDLPFR